MAQRRLNDSMTLHVHKERVDRFNLDKIFEKYVSAIERTHGDSWVDFLERFENFVGS